MVSFKKRLLLIKLSVQNTPGWTGFGIISKLLNKLSDKKD